MKPRIPCLASAAALLALFLGGCASQRTPRADDSDYVYVAVTGSNVPVRVHKSALPNSAAAATGGETSVLSGDALYNERMRAISPIRPH